jgi:hypothetical protein
MAAILEENPPSDLERLEVVVDQAIAACGGDLRETIRAVILKNQFLEAQTSKGFIRGYDHSRFKTYTG